MPRISTLTSVPAPLKKLAPIEEVKPDSPGIRKLVRPTLVGLQDERSPARFHRREEMPMLAHQMAHDASQASRESTHAETFYLQKQVQNQTLMVFVMEDGQKIEGHIEWYDRSTIKVRHGGGRTLIYKSAIKYLYKAGENCD